MKAIGLYRYLPIDNPESLMDVEIAKPTASGRDLLVSVKAISVNPVDVKTRAPKEQVEKEPRVLGWDVAASSSRLGRTAHCFKLGMKYIMLAPSRVQVGIANFILWTSGLLVTSQRALTLHKRRHYL